MESRAGALITTATAKELVLTMVLILRGDGLEGGRRGLVFLFTFLANAPHEPVLTGRMSQDPSPRYVKNSTS